jgi:hypothetical protein
MHDELDEGFILKIMVVTPSLESWIDFQRDNEFGMLTHSNRIQTEDCTYYRITNSQSTKGLRVDQVIFCDWNELQFTGIYHSLVSYYEVALMTSNVPKEYQIMFT